MSFATRDSHTRQNPQIIVKHLEIHWANYNALLLLEKLGLLSPTQQQIDLIESLLTDLQQQ